MKKNLLWPTEIYSFKTEIIDFISDPNTNLSLSL